MLRYSHTYNKNFEVYINMTTGFTDLTERDKRYEKIRQELEKNSLQGLLIVSDSQIERRGCLRYVANNIDGTKLQWHYVLFPLKGEPIAVNVRGGWMEDRRMLPLRGGWVPESEPYAPVIVDIIRELNIEKGNIGIEGDFMPLPVYQEIVKELPEANFKLSNIIHELKRVKSPVEIEMVEKGAEMMDKAYEACIEFARTGVTWNDITSEICRTLYHWGAEDIGGYPMSRATGIIKQGDSYHFYPEPQCAGGYWIQMGRMISFGEPDKELRHAWDLNMKAQELGVEKLKPGYTSADVMRAMDEAIKGSEYTWAPRSSGHGIGLDILEKPFVLLDDEIVFEPNMVITLHPEFLPRVKYFESNADMFVITENGPRKLSRFSSEIKIIH
jgi:Xaa-Pro aminopeptidase